jgi:DNA-binding MarR family transcriptional regulator
MRAVTDGAHWLSEEDERVWRRWIRLMALLPTELQRELQADAGLSLPDYDVLVQLTDSPGHRVRVTDLARALSWERSRVSHHVARMQRRGLVERDECRDDGRGAYVVLTALGRTAIERAAPGHVRTVRRLVFDQLTQEQIEVMGAVTDAVLARLEDPSDTVSPSVRFA